MSNKFHVYLGTDRQTGYKVFLKGFAWDCNWYWGGGYLRCNYKNGKQAIHTHFNCVFLDGVAHWKDLNYFLLDVQFDSAQWWRIKDLYKQFYTLTKAAEVFQYGGHCTLEDRSRYELCPAMAYTINHHIEYVIIPEIKKALKISL